GVEAQVQGAIAYGLGAALHSAITLADGRVQQSNFHDYRVLRLAQMPVVEVHLTGGGDKPTGAGEPATRPSRRRWPTRSSRSPASVPASSRSPRCNGPESH